MSSVAHSARGLPGRPKQAAAGGTERFYWEEILVQITLGFMIILGYLVSVGVNETSDLTALVREQQQRGRLMETMIAELRGTESGEARAGRVAAEREMQLERLLRVWAEWRVQRRLYVLLRQFDNAELIPLAEDLKCLPTSAGFGELNREANRVFLVAGQKVSAKEIEALLIFVLERAGFNPEAALPALDEKSLSPTAAELYFDRDVPDRDNLRMLKLRVVDDLEEERRQLCRLQYALVSKIAAARRDRLAALPLSQDVSVAPEETDLGLHMLDQILEDLKKEVQLLPEAVQRIRQGASGKPDPDHENEPNH